MGKLTNPQITLIAIGSIVTIGAIGVGGYYAGWFTKGTKPKQEAAAKVTTPVASQPIAAASTKAKKDWSSTANATLSVGKSVIDNWDSLFGKKTTTAAEGDIEAANLRIAENGAIVSMY